MQEKLSIRTALTTFVLALAFCGALPLAAESSPEARKWLDKLQGMFDRGAFTLEFEGALEAASIGKGTLVGEVIYADTTHLRTRLDIALESSATGGETNEVKVLAVQDGTSQWSEINLLGTAQVTRSAISSGGDPGLDPVSQLQTIADTLNFEVKEVAAGRVELTAAVDEATRSSLGQLGSIPGVDGFVLVLDQKTGHPLEFRSTGDVPVVSMRFKNVQQVERTELPADTFTYEPPEGVQVMELGGQNP